MFTFSFELNLSASESALKLVPHFSPFTSKDSDKALRVSMLLIIILLKKTGHY